MIIKKAHDIREILLQDTKNEDIITGGVLKPSLADRIKRKAHRAIITAGIIITLLGPTVPRAIAQSNDPKQKIEYVENQGAYQEVVHVRDLIRDINRMFRQDDTDWDLLNKKIVQLYDIGLKLDDADIIQRSADYMRDFMLIYAMHFVGEGNFTKAFLILNEFMETSIKQGRIDWTNRGLYTKKLIVEIIGNEQNFKGYISVIAANGGYIDYDINSLVLTESGKTYFAATMKYTSRLSEDMTKELLESTAKDFLKKNFKLRDNIKDEDIIIEHGKVGEKRILTAKILIDLK